MNQYELARKREEALFNLLVEAARSGKPCPTLPQMCPVAGTRKPATISKAIGRLQDQGRIACRGSYVERIVEIPSLGISTAPRSDFRRNGEPKRPIAEIIDLSARIAGLAPADITAHRRGRLFARPRMLVYRFAHAEGWTFKSIGRAIGRDHSTVVYGIGAAEQALKHDPLFARMHARMIEAMDGCEPPPLYVRPAVPRAPQPRPSPPALPAPRTIRSEPGEYVPRHALPLPVDLPMRDYRDDGAVHGLISGSRALLRAIQRAYPERCAA